MLGSGFIRLSCLGFAELSESIHLCLSPNLEGFQPYSSNIFISPTSFSFISETPLAQVLGLFTLSHRSLRLSSLFSNIFSLRLDTSYYLSLLTLFSVTSILPLSPSSEHFTSYILFLRSKFSFGSFFYGVCFSSETFHLFRCVHFQVLP